MWRPVVAGAAAILGEDSTLLEPAVETAAGRRGGAGGSAVGPARGRTGHARQANGRPGHDSSKIRRCSQTTAASPRCCVRSSTARTEFANGRLSLWSVARPHASIHGDGRDDRADDREGVSADDQRGEGRRLHPGQDAAAVIRAPARLPIVNRASRTPASADRNVHGFIRQAPLDQHERGEGKRRRNHAERGHRTAGAAG